MSRIVDAMLLQGTQHLSSRLNNRTADYVISKRVSDGGYPGRLGGSDPYYTDFALRILSLTRPEEIHHPATLDYAEWNSRISDIPECFNRLSIAQLCGVELPLSARDCLDRHRLSSGCFCRSAELPAPSAYSTFLGTVCEDILGLDSRNSMDSINAILKLQSSDGGFSDTGSDPISQTNPTSAALGYLIKTALLSGEMDPGFDAAINRAAAYFLSVQAQDGGFLAHAKTPYPDLLSTFTALATLIAMNRIEQVHLKKHAQFAGLMANADGGFRSCIVDAESDIEHAYYGFGCLALIAFIAKARFD
jgi:geranylgeranyl transferase type-2 subunit beta